VAVLWTERLPQGAGYVVRAQPLPVPLPERAADGSIDDEAAAIAINRSMEQVILQRPSQYLWGYHRYKQPRQVESAS
jgi:KDO2-lipid IV(A) lauroyltransferase